MVKLPVSHNMTIYDFNRLYLKKFQGLLMTHLIVLLPHQTEIPEKCFVQTQSNVNIFYKEITNNHFSNETRK